MQYFSLKIGLKVNARKVVEADSFTYTGTAVVAVVQDMYVYSTF